MTSHRQPPPHKHLQPEANSMSGKISATYIYRQVLNIDAIAQWMLRHGVRLPDHYDPLHVTSIYSDKIAPTHVPLEKTSHYIRPCFSRKHALFGMSGVLLLTSSHLQRRFSHFVRLGICHTFPEYNPHLTLQEGPIDPSIRPYDGPIILGPEIMEQNDIAAIA